MSHALKENAIPSKVLAMTQGSAIAQSHGASRLPQSGVWFDDELAKIFQVEVSTIREWVYRTGIPHIPAFRGILVDMADIIAFARVVPQAKPAARKTPSGRTPRKSSNPAARPRSRK